MKRESKVRVTPLPAKRRKPNVHRQRTKVCMVGVPRVTYERLRMVSVVTGRPMGAIVAQLVAAIEVGP